VVVRDLVSWAKAQDGSCLAFTGMNGFGYQNRPRVADVRGSGSWVFGLGWLDGGVSVWCLRARGQDQGRGLGFSGHLAGRGVWEHGLWWVARLVLASGSACGWGGKGNQGIRLYKDRDLDF
jgi:hypothetical protein